MEEGREAFFSPDEEHRTIGALSRIAHDCNALHAVGILWRLRISPPAPVSLRRTKIILAIKEELELHYFSQPQQLDDINEGEELSAEEKMLQGYQALCHEVGIDPSDSVAECKRNLKNTLVNIVDLIDARRTVKRVEGWDSFEEFRAYTLQDKKRIDLRETKRPPGYLALLLQRLSGPPSRKNAMVLGRQGWRPAVSPNVGLRCKIYIC